MTLLNIFTTYIKIGFMAFGGGYAMLPILEKEFVEKRQWITDDQLMEDFALAGSLPGIIAVNTATFLGYRLRGVRGGIVAALGVIIPSILIITIIAAFFQNFANIPWVQSIFRGLNIAIIVLLISAVIKMWKRGVKDIITFIIFGITVAAYLITGLNPVLLVLAGAIAGLILAGRGQK